MTIEKTYTNKKLLRKKIKELKQSLAPEKNIVYSKQIFERIESFADFINAKTVIVYWSLPDEVSTHDFIMKWSTNKRIALPIVVGENLEFRLFADLNSMEKSGSFGILEPQTGERIDPQDIDFAIIPGLAFDLKGNRLGRGKGYYDRVLSQIKGTKVGVVFSFQIVDEVPVTSFDIPVDFVVTEKN